MDFDRLLRAVEVQIVQLPIVGLQHQRGDRGKIFVVAVRILLHARARGDEPALAADPATSTSSVLPSGCSSVPRPPVRRNQVPSEHADLAARRQKKHFRSLHQRGDLACVPFQVGRHRTDCAQDPDFGLVRSPHATGPVPAAWRVTMTVSILDQSVIGRLRRRRSHQRDGAQAD